MNDSDHQTPSGVTRFVAVAFLLGMTLLIGGIGFWAWKTYDPFFMNRPANVQAKAFLDQAVKKQPLSDEQFAEAIRLLNGTEPYARQAVLSVLEVEAGRSAERKAQVIESLKAVVTTDATLRRVIDVVLKRLE
jgi:predicted negative regulator of RcsB-dependent stress response